MSLKEIYKKLTKNFSTLVPTIKNDWKNIPKNIKTIVKVIAMDSVDVIVFLIAIILSTVDFITTWNLTGAIAFLTLYILGLLFRMAIWKLKANTK